MNSEVLQEIVTPLVESLGLELWGLECGTGKRSLVRIYVEAPRPLREAGKGVTIDQCAEVSRNVGLALEVEDIMPGPYTLEVTSPGMNRPFFSPAQLQEYLGETVHVTLFQPLARRNDQRRHFKGILRQVRGDRLLLEWEEEELDLAWDQVKQARLAPQITVPKRDSARKRKKQERQDTAAD
jgi:ribosome maturation factor RimP